MQVFSFLEQYAEFYHIPFNSLISFPFPPDEELMQIALDLGFDFGCCQ